MEVHQKWYKSDRPKEVELRKQHRLLWQWVADGNTKKNWPEWDSLWASGRFWIALGTHCFACEMALIRYNDEKAKTMDFTLHPCQFCPIPLWRNNKKIAGCMESGSLYDRFINTEDRADKGILATLIRDAWPDPEEVAKAVKAKTELKPFKIEKNRYYLTRGGELAYVYYTKFINAGGTFPIGGAIRRGKGSWYLASWTDKGRYISARDIEEDDLVSLVEKPDRLVMKDPPEFD